MQEYTSLMTTNSERPGRCEGENVENALDYIVEKQEGKRNLDYFAEKEKSLSFAVEGVEG